MRQWDSLEEMAWIAPGVAVGCNRQSLTDADGEGRHLFRTRAEEAGMTMTADRMGNMFCLSDGTEAGLLPVVMGSARHPGPRHPADGREMTTACRGSWTGCT